MLDVFSWRSLRSLLVLGMLIPTVLWGQGARGTINGTVTDATGAVIPGAKVEITNAKTGVVTTTETGINGVYYMPNMLFGEYNIAAESDGFKRAEVLGLRLNVGSEIQQSFALEIGAVTETVEVSAAQVQVQTTSGAVGSAVQIEQMMELPLAGRNIFNLVNLVPG
ncbi:MAG: carboxypeptidase-like regulatory domain-containing protein, partial [Bryobacterales bacterium]|nr:carboxypeptidase-like regulatory domain-containing protein [Bryobacterales bacterium]